MESLALDPSGHVADEFALDDGVRGLRKQRTRALLWLTLVFWGSNLALLTLGTALSRSPHLRELTGMRIVTTVAGLALCFLIHLLLQRPGLWTTRKRLIALVIVAPIAAETFAWASYFAEASVEPALRSVQITGSAVVRTISFWTWFFLAWSGLYLAVSYSFDLREEQQRSADLREREHVAQLRALHSQINPHFLFNSLNSVSALILDRKVEQAEEMVGKLARFLRLGLAADPTEKIALAAEIGLQRAYLEIEQLRYADLRIDINVPDALEGARVPALILQPIVENAVKYGVAGAPPPATIAIDAAAKGSQLVLKVRDSGKGGGKAGAGIGLANIRQRLQLIYGAVNADLQAGPVASGGFEVTLCLPLELA